jgi:hypothetical protein
MGTCLNSVAAKKKVPETQETTALELQQHESDKAFIRQVHHMSEVTAH